ncbi:hypothetical protein GCM10020367_54990 [Streptomyces sannanensis]|uniref:Alpha/beta hydrolase n=1 Tax=Streptomyces sannanensis TaxID=285536 RepID=A0ABP6SIM1_9ACTN
MKPRLVFVHGIGGPRDVAAECKEWLQELAAGARAAGHSHRVLDLMQGWAADARFAYYGDLFRPPEAQGAESGAGKDADNDLVVGLLLEAVDERLADPGLGGTEERTLRHARAQLAPTGVPQGAGSAGRRALNALTTLMSVPGLRRIGGWGASRLTVTALGQVARYLGRGEPDSDGLTLDTRIRQRVADTLDPEGPTIVVSHSLGTVVALETLHAHQGFSVPLLVTLGSPIGMRTVVLPHLRPQPLQVPAQVGKWLNFWDRDDIIAARPRLEAFVRPNAATVLPVTSRVDSDGVWVHPAAKYLAQPAVAGPVVEALESIARA